MPLFIFWIIFLLDLELNFGDRVYISANIFEMV